MRTNFSLILPIHNQESIIAPVIDSIINAIPKGIGDFEIIAVENGSTDNTLSELKKLKKKYKFLKVVTAKKGYGSAVIKGLNKAKGKYVCYMPSDGQLDPHLIYKLYNLIKNDKFDIVKIRRISRESTIRFVRSKVFNIISRSLFIIPFSDINGSPRIFLRKWLTSLDLKFTDSFIDCEMAIKAYYLKWRFKEIPAYTLQRLGGKSTVNIDTVIEFIRNLATYRFDKRLTAWILKNS